MELGQKTFHLFIGLSAQFEYEDGVFILGEHCAISFDGVCEVLGKNNVLWAQTGTSKGRIFLGSNLNNCFKENERGPFELNQALFKRIGKERWDFALSHGTQIASDLGWDDGPRLIALVLELGADSMPSVVEEKSLDPARIQYPSIPGGPYD